MRLLGFITRWGLGLLLLLYALCIGALQAVWHTGIGHSWWTDVLNVFGLWLYLPLPLGLIAAAFARPKGLSWLMLVPVLAFGWDYHGLLNWNTPTPEGTALRVMTWNILYRPHPLEPLVETIREQHPDIIALQELGVRQAAELEPVLAQEYPYSAVDPGGSDGLGVWSRYPLSAVTPRDQRFDGCACQQMTLTVNAREVHLINAHPEAPRYRLRRWRPSKWVPYVPVPQSFSTERTDAAHHAIAEEAQQAQGPLIIVGDFNLSDRQPNYQMLHQSLQDAYREAGSGFGLTFPNAHLSLGRFTIPPLIRIDYIWHSTHLQATSARTIANQISDHRGVVADLVLLQGGSADATSQNGIQHKGVLGWIRSKTY